MNIRADHFYENRIPCEQIFKSGAFSYRVNQNFFQVPKGFEDKHFFGIVCDKNDTIYCTVRHPKCPILVFNPDGSFKRYLAEGLDCGMAHGISIGSDGNIWMSDCTREVIFHLDVETGALIEYFGNMNVPSDTGIDDGHPGWAKRSNVHLKIKRRADPFNWPCRLIEASDGKLYAADGYRNVAIHRYSHEGVYEKAWGAHGEKDDESFYMHSIWEDPRKRLWIADRDQGRITAFDHDGNFLKTIRGFMMASDIWSDDEYLYVSELDGRISILDMDCNIVALIGYVSSNLMCHSIAGDSKSNLYLGWFGAKSCALRLERI